MTMKKILTAVDGSIKTERGFEQKSYSLIRAKKLTWRGAQRIAQRENPGTTFRVHSIEYAVYER